jgi:hypothetical protein
LTGKIEIERSTKVNWGFYLRNFGKKIDLGYIKIDLMRKGQRIGDRSKKLGFVSLRLMFVCLDLGVVRGEELVGRPYGVTVQ